MAKRRGRPKKQPSSSENNGDQEKVQLDNKEEAFYDHEVERQSAAIRALRDVEIEQLRTMIRLLHSYFDKEQTEVPVKQFFKENFQNLSIVKTGTDGKYEVQWNDKNGNLSLNHTDDNALHASLLHRLSLAYPDFSTGMASLGGFEFSNKSVKTGLFGADKLQIRSLVLEEPSDSQTLELKEGLQTPNVSNTRMFVGMTPKTLRLPKHGETLLSVHGSPLGVYKEDNMETMQEADDG